VQLAQVDFDRQTALIASRTIAQATLDISSRNFEAAKQTLLGARAEQERARLAYSSNIEGVNTTVARLRAELADAQYDLDQTVTRAAGNGFITQLAWTSASRVLSAWPPQSKPAQQQAFELG
jgi:multidrug resistance efflux pump